MKVMKSTNRINIKTFLVRTSSDVSPIDDDVSENLHSSGEPVDALNHQMNTSLNENKLRIIKVFDNKDTYSLKWLRNDLNTR